jgi:transcriptional regulator with XRE-family HTH domain
MHSWSIHHQEVHDLDVVGRALALRQRTGLTQREFAAHLGVSHKAIGSWEGGFSYPGAERLRRSPSIWRVAC